jgi:hypothetical protein
VTTDRAPLGRPVAVRVFLGDIADPVAFTKIVEVMRTGFGRSRQKILNTASPFGGVQHSKSMYSGQSYE